MNCVKLLITAKEPCLMLTKLAFFMTLFCLRNSKWTTAIVLFQVLFLIGLRYKNKSKKLRNLLYSMAK